MALGGIGKAVSGIGKSISKGIGGIGKSLGGLGKKLGGLGKGLSSIAGKFGSLVQKPFSAVKKAFAPLQNSVNKLLDKTPFGNLLKPLANLASLRRNLRTSLAESTAEDLPTTCEEARAAIASVEAALAKGGFLETTYAFDPDLEDEAPHFTPEEEAFGRSGGFVEA